MDAYYFPTGVSQKDSGLEIKLMLDTGAACSIRSYRTLLEIAQFRQPITEVRSKQKTITYSGELYSWLNTLVYLSALIQMENTSLNCEYGLPRHRPRIYSGLNFADNRLRNCISNYLQKNSKLRRTLSAMVICVQQNPTPLPPKYTLLERPIRSTLMPRLPEIGKSHRKMDQKASHQELPSSPIETLC